MFRNDEIKGVWENELKAYILYILSEQLQWDFTVYYDSSYKIQYYF